MAALLGIDLGTSGVKAALFDAATGRALASATAGYPLRHPRPGWAEQDAGEWWAATTQAIRDCLALGAAAGVASGDIRGLGISGQMHGAVLLDDRDQPVRPVIIWADQRTQAQCDAIHAAVGLARLVARTGNPALPGFTAPKLLWVRDNDPATWARVRRVLLPKDYLRLRLTGTPAMEISDAAGTGLLDVAAGDWAWDVLAALGLDPALFPPIVGAADIAGRITSDAAALTGLPAGLPVAGGGADNACAAVGAGIVQPGQALVSIGTSGVALAFSPTPAIDRSGPIPRVHTFNHAVPAAWYLMGVTQAAGLTLRWLRDQIGAAEHAEAQATGRDAYDLMTELAATVPAGSDGLLFLPYLQGERTPVLDARARAGWVGLTAAHTRAHLYRAALEGVAFSLRDCLDVLRDAGVEIAELRVTGGGARSAVWRQLLADVFAEPLAPLAVEEGPALGAALLAGVAAGVYPSVPAACAAVVRTVALTTPDPAAVAVYARQMPLYRALYPALRDIMHDLAAN